VLTILKLIVGKSIKMRIFLPPFACFTLSLNISTGHQECQNAYGIEIIEIIILITITIYRLEFDKVSEWWLLNANSTFFQLHHGENKLIFNEMMRRFALY
jgi:hypothetical protein